MSPAEVQAIVTKLVQAVTGVSILKSGQLIVHFDADGKARKMEVSQVHHLTTKDT